MAVDDCSRLAVGEVLPDERQGPALGSDWHRSHTNFDGRPPITRVPPADKYVRFQS
jgi:hypothetical protein